MVTGLAGARRHMNTCIEAGLPQIARRRRWPGHARLLRRHVTVSIRWPPRPASGPRCTSLERRRDRKSTRLNSSHVEISYAVFCLKKKKKKKTNTTKKTTKKYTNNKNKKHNKR